MDLVISILTISVESIAAMLLFGAWLPQYPRRPHWAVAVLSFVIVFFLASQLMRDINWLRTLVIVIFLVLWSLPFWSGGIGARVALAVCYISLVNSIDYLFIGLVGTLLRINVRQLYASVVYFVLITTISKALLVGICVILYKTVAPYHIQRNWQDWLRTMLVPLVLVVLSLFVADTLRENSQFGEQLLMNVLFLGGTSALYLLQVSQAERTHQQVRLHSENERQLTEQNRAQRKLLHDQLGFAALVQQFLLNGEQDKALDLLHQQLQRTKQVPRRLHTGHVVADYVLNLQCAQAQEEGIAFQPGLCEFAGIHLQELDLFLLLNNLLDNARHACLACPGDKVIMLETEVDTEAHSWLLTVRNTCPPPSAPPTAPTPGPVPLHGYGCGIIEETVQRYGGQCMVTQQENWYTVHVMLFSGRWLTL